jgi:hypothetical protein
VWHFEETGYSGSQKEEKDGVPNQTTFSFLTHDYFFRDMAQRRTSWLIRQRALLEIAPKAVFLLGAKSGSDGFLSSR